MHNIQKNNGNQGSLYDTNLNNALFRMEILSKFTVDLKDLHCFITPKIDDLTLDIQTPPEKVFGPPKHT